MTSKNKNPLPVKCLFAQFDILGFKNLFSKLNETNHLGLKQLADSYTKDFAGNLYYAKEKIKCKPKYQVFSDTVFAYTKYEFENGDKVSNIKNEMEDFFKYLSTIMQNTIISFTDINKHNFPIRGGVSIGQIIGANTTSGKSKILMGQPIINAYLWEQSQNWLGISINPTDIDAIKTALNDNADNLFDELINKNIIVEYDIPTKDGLIKSWAINFVSNEKVTDLLNALKNEANLNKDKSKVYAKYYATIKFVEYIKNENKFTK